MEKEHSNENSITETMNESRKRFEAKFGRLLTEDEAISLTSNIKKLIGHCDEADIELAQKEINALMKELEQDVVVTNHCWINFHFENLEYDDTCFAGDFYPDDNNGQYHCSFRYDRIKKTYEIFNNEVSEEEILPLPIGYLEWKLEKEGMLDKTVWKISM